MKGSSFVQAKGFSRAIPVSLALSLLFAARSVLAQTDSSREQADALFERGKTALKEGDWQSACADFQASRELDESASTVVKIARCHEHAGQFLRARAEYERALSLIRARPATDTHARDLESLIESSITALEGRLAHVRIRLNPQPSRAVVLVDGQAAGALEHSQSEIVVPLDPGEHTLWVEAAEYTASPVPIELTEQQMLDLSVTLTPTSSASEAPVAEHEALQPAASVRTSLRPADRREVEHASTGGTQRLMGYVTGGTGIVLAGVAGYFGVRTRSYVDDARVDNHCDGNYRCDRRGLELIDAAREQQRNAIIAGVSGGILLTTGIVLLATAPAKRSKAVGPEKRLVVSVGPLGAVVGGHW